MFEVDIDNRTNSVPVLDNMKIWEISLHFTKDCRFSCHAGSEERNVVSRDLQKAPPVDKIRFYKNSTSIILLIDNRTHCSCCYTVFDQNKYVARQLMGLKIS